MGSLSAGILLLLGLIIFNNYRNGTLPDWLKAKFLNSAAPSDGGSNPFAVSSTVLSGGAHSGPESQAVLTGLGGGLGSLQLPVSGSVTGKFGESRPGHKHGGIDYAAPTGTPVRAARGGTVSYAGNAADYGLLVTVDHGGGHSTRYAHLSEIGVSVGQRVLVGATVGKVGSTGRSTGPHLHFELRRDGVAVDPSAYLGTPASVGAALTG